MFCPFVRKSQVSAVAIHYIRDNNNNLVEDGSVTYNEFTNEECKKEQCGVWRDGGCRYDTTT